MKENDRATSKLSNPYKKEQELLKNKEYKMDNNGLAPCVSKHQKTFVNLAIDHQYLENSNYGPNLTAADQNGRYVNQYMEMGLKKLKILIEYKFRQSKMQDY
jgi:hypothetical protein